MLYIKLAVILYNLASRAIIYYLQSTPIVAALPTLLRLDTIVGCSSYYLAINYSSLVDLNNVEP